MLGKSKSDLNFDKLINDTFFALDKSDDLTKRKDLKDSWSKISFQYYLAQPKAQQKLEELYSRVAATASTAPWLRTLLTRIHSLFQKSLQRERVAYQHLLSTVKDNPIGEGYFKKTRELYPSVKQYLTPKLMFQLFSDEWGEGRRDHMGLKLEGMDPTDVLHYYMLTSQFGATKNMCSAYETAYKWSKEISKTSWENSEALVEKIIEAVGALKPGENLHIPGGWTGTLNKETIGHSLMYQVLCKPEGQYFFRIFNSGAGLNFHLEGTLERTYRPGSEWGPLSEEKRKDKSFWKELFEPTIRSREALQSAMEKFDGNIFSLLRQMENDPTYDENNIYSAVENHLGKSHPAEKIRDLKQQRAGTCSRKSVDLITRSHVSEEEYKLIRIEQKVVGLCLLEQMLEEKALKPGDRQLLHEIFVKGYRSTWNDMAKCSLTFGKEAGDRLQPWASALQHIHYQELDDQIRSTSTAEEPKPVTPTQLEPKAYQEASQRAQLIAVNSTPSLRSWEMKRSLPTFTPPRQLTNESLAVWTVHLQKALALAVKMSDRGPTTVQTTLQSLFFCSLPVPTVTKKDIWHQLQQPSREAVTDFLAELFRAALLSLDVGGHLETLPPTQLVDIWKAVAIATTLCRKCKLLDLKVSICWAPWKKLTESPEFSYFTDPLRSDVEEITRFLQDDSPGGDTFVGSRSESIIGSRSESSKWEKIPLFDYTWVEGPPSEVMKTPEYKLLNGTSSLLFTPWRQLANLASSAVFDPLDMRDATYHHKAELVEAGSDNRLFNPTYDHDFYTGKITATTPRKKDSAHSPNPQLFSCKGEGKFSIPMHLFSKDIRLAQAEIIKRTQQRGETASQETYTLELISSSPPEIRLHLLLNYFEENAEDLHNAEYLEYFRGILRSRKLLADVVSAESPFGLRLVTFLEGLAQIDNKRLYIEDSAHRLGSLLMMLTELTRASGGDAAVPMRKAAVSAIERLRKQLIDAPPKNPVLASRIALYQLASYHWIPRKNESAAQLFNLMLKASGAPIKTVFDAQAKNESQQFALQQLPELLNSLKDPAQRKALLEMTLDPDESHLLNCDYTIQEDLSQEIQQSLTQLRDRLQGFKEPYENYEILLEKYRELEEKILNLDAIECDLELYRKLNTKLPAIKKNLPSFEEYQKVQVKLHKRLKALPGNWILTGSVLMISANNALLEIDLLSGEVFRNGIPSNQTLLPSAVQAETKCRLFGNALKEPCKVTYEGFQLLCLGFENVLFKTNANNDVIFKYLKEEFLLLNPAISENCKLPENLLLTDLSVWAKIWRGDPKFLLCGHSPDGAPEPLFFTDGKGAIHPLDHAELKLCGEVPEAVGKLFRGLCPTPYSGLCWVDAEEKPASIDLPLNLNGQRMTRFERVEGQWRLADNPEYHLAENQYVADLPQDLFFVVLETNSGRHQLLLENRSITEQLRRTTSCKPITDILQLQAQEYPALMIQLTRQGLAPANPLERLAVAYRQLMWGEYQGSRKTLQKGIRPLGRGWSRNELEILQLIVNSHDEKADLHPDAGTLRLYIMQQMQKHLREHPLKKEQILSFPEALQGFVVGWMPPPTEPELKKVFKPIASHLPAAIMYDAMKIRSPGSELLQVHRMIPPSEELEFIRGMLEGTRTVTDAKHWSYSEEASLEERLSLLTKHPEPVVEPEDEADEIELEKSEESYKPKYERQIDSKVYPLLAEIELQLTEGYYLTPTWPPRFDSFSKKGEETIAGLWKHHLDALVVPELDKATSLKDIKKAIENWIKLCRSDEVRSWIGKNLKSTDCPYEDYEIGMIYKLFSDPTKQRQCEELLSLLKYSGGAENFKNWLAKPKLGTDLSSIATVGLVSFFQNQGGRLYLEIAQCPTRRARRLISYCEKHPSIFQDEPSRISLLIELAPHLKETTDTYLATELDKLSQQLDILDQLFEQELWRPRLRSQWMLLTAKKKDFRNLPQKIKDQLHEVQHYGYYSDEHGIKCWPLSPPHWEELSEEEIFQKITTLPDQFDEVYQRLLKEHLRALYPALKEVNSLEEALKILHELDELDELDDRKEYIHDLIQLAQNMPKLIVPFCFGIENLDLARFEEVFSISDKGNFEKIKAELEDFKKLAEDSLQELKFVKNELEKRLQYEKPLRGGEPWEVTRILHDWEEDAKVPCPSAPSIPLNQLPLQEQWIDTVPMLEVYSRTVSAQHLIAPNDLANTSEPDQSAIKKLVKQLDSFRQEQTRAKPKRLKKTYVEKLKKQVRSRRSELQNQATAMEGQILAIANTLPVDEVEAYVQTFREMGSKKHVLDINECIGLALRNSNNLWEARTHLKGDEVVGLQNLMLTYLLLTTEIQHMDRGAKKLTNYDKTKRTELLEELGDWLTSQRAYTPNELQSGEAWEFLVFEHYSGKRIYPYQKEMITQLGQLPVGTEAKGLVLQLVMGAGKSKFIGPILGVKAANGINISTLCFPNSLYATGVADFTETVFETLHARTDTLNFTRQECSRDKLYRLIIKMDEATKDGKILLHRPRDLHSLKMMLDERDELIYQKRDKFAQLLKELIVMHLEIANEEKSLLDYILLERNEVGLELDAVVQGRIESLRQRFVAEQPMIEEYEAEIHLLRIILQRLSQRQTALFDEFDSIFDPKNQVSFPIGTSVPVNPIGIKIAVELYFSVLPDFESKLKLSSDAQTMVTPEVLQAITDEIRNRLWERFEPNFLGKKKAFLEYLRNSNSEQAQSFYKELASLHHSKLQLDRNIADEISFWKRALCQELPTALQAAGHVGYERSLKDPGLEVVLPCEHNGVPKEGSRFKNPWETAFKTCQFYYQNWMYPRQTEKLLSFALGAVDPSTGELIYESSLKALFGDLETLNTTSPPQLQRYTEVLQEGLKPKSAVHLQTLALIQGYLERVVFPEQLRQDPVQLTSKPLDLAEVPGSTRGYSGTRMFHHAWSTRVESVENYHTDAINIDPLTDPQNDSCVIVDNDPQNIIHNTLSQGGVERVSAFIDAGPACKGRDNLDLAREFLRELQALGSLKKAIVFFQQHPDGSSTVSLLKGVKMAPIALNDSSKETLKKALGDAISLSEVATLYDNAHTFGADIFQEEGAVAYVTISDQLRKDHLLQAVARMRHLADRKHTIRCVLPKSIAEVVAAHAKKDLSQITISDVVNYTQCVQLHKEIPVNGQGIRDKLAFFLTREVYKKRLEATSPAERRKLYEQYRPRLVSLRHPSLFEEFGALETEIETATLLQKEMKTVDVELKTLGVDRSKELNDFLESSLEFVPLPQKMSEIGQDVESSIEIEQVVAAEEDVQQEVRLSREEEERIPFREKSWPTNLEKKELFEPVSVGSSAPEWPALYRLRDCHEPMKGLISPNILISENLLRTFEDNANAWLTEDQKPLHHILVVKDNLRDPVVVLVSTLESAGLVIRLAGRSSNNADNRQLTLIDANGEVIQRGGTPWKNPFHGNQSPLAELLIQTLFLKGSVKRLSVEPYIAHLETWIGKQKNRSEYFGIFERLLAQRPTDLAIFLGSYRLQRILSDR